MTEHEKESWNMANATLQRFDLILKQSSMCAQTGNLLQWKNCLMDLRRNLFPFMSKKEFDDVKVKFDSLPAGWNSTKRGTNPQYFARVNKIFDEIYMDFIMIMKKKGLLMPKTVDSGKSVIEM